jgi:hypothetical protein
MDNQDRKALFKLFGWGVIIIITILLASWILGWITMPWELTSPRNVKEQWTWAYEQHESLKATAQQVCIAERAVELAQSDTERTQRQTQLIAYETNYSRLAADYDAKMQNAFEMKLIKPADLPWRAPVLSEAKQHCN